MAWNLLGDLKLTPVVRRGYGVLMGFLGSFSDLSLLFRLSSLQFAFPCMQCVSIIKAPARAIKTPPTLQSSEL